MTETTTNRGGYTRGQSLLFLPAERHKRPQIVAVVWVGPMGQARLSNGCDVGPDGRELTGRPGPVGLVRELRAAQPVGMPCG